MRGTASYILVIAETLRLAERPDELITRAEIDAAVEEWGKRPRKRDQNRRLVFTGHAIRWLQFLGRLQLPPVDQRPYADYVDQWTDYLLRERGLAPGTVKLNRRTLHAFLAEIQLKKLSVAQVDELLVKAVRDGRYARTTVSRRASILRTFFEFGERRGWCRRGLAAARG